MKLIAFAVLLAIMQTVQSVPGKAPSNSARSSQHVPQNANAGKQPAQTATAIPANDDQNKRTAPAEADAEKTIIIGETAPMSKKDRWDKAYVVFTGLLVAIGAVGACAAYRTLRAIEAQGVTMQGQLTAMQAQLIVMQRPKLAVKHVFIIPDQSITGRPEDGHTWKVGCLIANVGESPADVVDSDLSIPNLGIGRLEEIIQVNSVPHYAKKYSFGTCRLQPSESRKVTVTLDVNSEEIMRFRTARAYLKTKIEGGGSYDLVSDTNPLICFGFFKYKDANGIARVTGFAWQWNKRDMSFARLDNPNYEYTD
ncbi:MAG TPA: hypothetical protein VMT67_06525 [Terriglobales bacterium]|nr:hypothetical protein [Terriglobales bacterium]